MPHAGASKGEREVRKGDEVDIDTDRQSAAGAGKTCIHPLLSETVTKGSVSNFVFKAVLIRPGLLRQGEKNRLTAPSPG